MKTKSLSYYQKKADRAIQDWGRRTYKKCLVCGQPISCLHHYFPKSVSSSLRYYEPNLIPICIKCHFRHHAGDPRIQNIINETKGASWLQDLQDKKREQVKPNKTYYKSIIKKYE